MSRSFRAREREREHARARARAREGEEGRSHVFAVGLVRRCASGRLTSGIAALLITRFNYNLRACRGAPPAPFLNSRPCQSTNTTACLFHPTIHYKIHYSTDIQSNRCFSCASNEYPLIQFMDLFVPLRQSALLYSCMQERTRTHPLDSVRRNL